MSKSVLITGASGELGKLTAITLLNHGYTVIASMRHIKGKNENIAQELYKLGALIVEIDVTEDESVTKGVNEALKHVSKLDVVINNAGIGAYGLEESFTPSDWKKIFEVNVFGVQRINRAVLPYMHQQHNGMLIHISSLIGRMVLPFWGAYSASKWALEALAESYKVELSGVGIESYIIEPGPYPTTFFEALLQPSDLTREKNYGVISKYATESFSDFGNFLNTQTSQNLENVANAIVNLISIPTEKRKFRTVVDSIGMGEHIEDCNARLEDLTSDIYSLFGLDSMLELNKKV